MEIFSSERRLKDLVLFNLPIWKQKKDAIRFYKYICGVPIRGEAELSRLKKQQQYNLKCLYAGYEHMKT